MQYVLDAQFNPTPAVYGPFKLSHSVIQPSNLHLGKTTVGKDVTFR